MYIKSPKKGVGGMSGTNKSEKIRDSTRRLTTTSQQQKNSSCCPWGRRGSRGLKKGTIRGDGLFAGPERTPTLLPGLRNNFGHRVGSRCGHSDWARWTPPAAKSGPSHNEKFPNERAAAGCGAPNYSVYAERFEANVRLTMTAARQTLGLSWQRRAVTQTASLASVSMSGDDGTGHVARCRPVAAITMTADESSIDGVWWAFPER